MNIIGRYTYTVFPFKRKEHWVWCYQIGPIRGKRCPRRSTGIRYTTESEKKKTRKQAVEYVKNICINMEVLGPEAVGLPAPKRLTLNQWANDYHWWEWGRCYYIRSSLARSEEGKPGITEGHAAVSRRIMNQRILKAHGNIPIDEITPAILEKLLFSWTQDVSFKTANNYRSVYSTMLGEATRLGLIDRNPWGDVKSLVPRARKTGCLTLEEGRKVLSPEALDTYWGGQEIYYLATKIAFLTGMRMGEVVALQVSDINQASVDDKEYYFVTVDKEWSPGLKRFEKTKDKDTRDIPLAPHFYDELAPLLNHQGFLFSFKKGKSPIAMNRLRLNFYDALERSGLKEDERKERNIKFHSARRFANTLWRMGNVPDAVLRRWTGHDDDAMTEHYTDYIARDMEFISDAQEGLLKNN